MFLKTIDRYILAKTLTPLSACIGVVLVALLLERMVRLIEMLVNMGGPFLFILKMLANLVPHYLGIAIPAAFFVGILMAIMRLSGDSELDAIYSMGMNLRRLLVPLTGLAILLTVMAAIIIGFLQPYTRYAYKFLIYTVTHTAWNSALERGTFFTGFGNMTIMVEGVDDGGRKLMGVYLHQIKEDGASTTITAEEGTLYRTSDDYSLVLSLTRGSWLDAPKDESAATFLSFDQLDLPLDAALDETPFRAREGERELTAWELWTLLDAPPRGTTRERMLSELNARIVRIISILFLPLLAVPLGIASRRARRSVGLVSGLVLLILFHHALQFGESLAEAGKVSPFVGIWAPWLLFVAISAWSFHAASTRPDYNLLTAAIDRLNEIADAARRRRAL